MCFQSTGVIYTKWYIEKYSIKCMSTVIHFYQSSLQKNRHIWCRQWSSLFQAIIDGACISFDQNTFCDH